MLRFLRITHLAVIDSVEVEFDPGFNVLTGEPGSGKSILVEAVGLLLGGRASGDLVRTGEDAASIEAIFESDGEELVVRREITSQGRSRAFVNGALATAGALKDLSGRLIELHGQHEHQTLLDPATHLGVLDAFGALEPVANRVAMAFAAMQASGDELARVRSSAADREARHDLIAFQLGEIDRAALRSGEDEELAALLQQIEDRLALIERLKRKHGPTLEDVIVQRDALRRELGNIEGGDDRVKELEREHAIARQAYLEVAAELSAARRRIAPAFT